MSSFFSKNGIWRPAYEGPVIPPSPPAARRIALRTAAGTRVFHLGCGTSLGSPTRYFGGYIDCFTFWKTTMMTEAQGVTFYNGNVGTTFNGSNWI